MMSELKTGSEAGPSQEDDDSDDSDGELPPLEEAGPSAEPSK